MSRNRTLGMLGAALLVSAAMVLAFTPGALAQSKYRTLHNFGGFADGSLPYGGLILDQAGNLYGTTTFGGVAPGHGGTVFQLTPTAQGGWTKSVLYNFCPLKNCADGRNPFYGSLIFDQAGNLYGTTADGGIAERGTVFKLTHNADGSWTESVLYDFCSLAGCADGASPYAGLIFDQVGNLYGTAGGGSAGGGTVFKLTHNADGSWTESVLYDFCSLAGCADGASPYAGLIFDQAGNLYGTTTGGGYSSCYGGVTCGVVFKLTPSADGSWKESVLHHFTGGRDGGHSFSVLIFDPAGNLYGTALQGGNLSYCNGIGCGVVFELMPNATGSWKESVLHHFTGKDGSLPVAGLAFDQKGNLYGTTGQGGAFGYGVVFKLAPNSKGGWSENTLQSFSDHPGAIPSAGLVFDTAGNLYGTTDGDSSTTHGTVFEIMP